MAAGKGAPVRGVLTRGRKATGSPKPETVRCPVCSQRIEAERDAAGEWFRPWHEHDTMHNI